jgi:aryl-alcohol dehydrogenase-like predicted oxidoreductase
MNIQGTAIETSRLGLGTHSLHRLVSAAERRDLLALALDLGVRQFDTAPSYGDVLAEHELGRLARERRSQLVLTTKFGIPGSGLGGRLPGWNHVAMLARAARKVVGNARSRTPRRHFSAEQARKSLEASLRALATDHVDVLFLHEPSVTCLEEVEALIRQLEALKAAGKVRYVGLSGQYDDCRQIAQRYPLLAQVLQVQVPAGPDGLPLEGYREPPEAAISFWEFPPGSARGSAESLRLTLTRLATANPKTVRLVSTNRPAVLREAVAVLGK